MKQLLLKGKILFLMLLTLGIATSCDEDEDDNTPMLTVPTFLQQAAASDMFELTTGNMAVQKGTLTEVKDFGQMLISDHTMSGSELISLAQQKNVTLPTTLPQDKAQKATTLQNLTGTAFDQQFADMQVQAHQEAIALYEQADKDITDAQVQAFIDKNLPVLRAHLIEAQSVEDSTD